MSLGSSEPIIHSKNSAYTDWKSGEVSPNIQKFPAISSSFLSSYYPFPSLKHSQRFPNIYPFQHVIPRFLIPSHYFPDAHSRTLFPRFLTHISQFPSFSFTIPSSQVHHFLFPMLIPKPYEFCSQGGEPRCLAAVRCRLAVVYPSLAQ